MVNIKQQIQKSKKWGEELRVSRNTQCSKYNYLLFPVQGLDQEFFVTCEDEKENFEKKHFICSSSESLVYFLFGQQDLLRQDLIGRRPVEGVSIPPIGFSFSTEGFGVY